MDLTPQDVARRRRGRRFNEQIELLAALLDNLAGGTLVGAILVPFLVPLASDRPVSSLVFEIWIPIGLSLHLAAQPTLGVLFESED